LVAKLLKRVFNSLKSEIKTYCSFSNATTNGGTRLKLVDKDLKLHLKRSLDDMLL